MLDAAVPGAIFASPSMIQVKAATEAIDRGLGVVHVVKNYTGDVINFGLARDLAIEEGLAVETVIVDDDLATDGSPDDGPGRRGTLGGPSRSQTTRDTGSRPTFSVVTTRR